MAGNRLGAFMEMAERMAKLESWAEGHTDQCKERYQDIRGDTTEIKAQIGSLVASLESTVKRIHERNEATSQQLAAEREFNATERSKIHSRIDGEKIKTLAGMVTGLLGLLGAVLQWAVGHVRP